MKTLFLFFMCSLASAKEQVVTMKSIQFDPKKIQIEVGDSIVWKNISYTEHSATGVDFDTGEVLPKKSSIPIVFSKPGEYDYHCRIHGKSMSAHISVEAAK